MRVLVAYGSTRGGTAGLAHMIADACAVQGIKTDVRRGGEVRSIDTADAVIVGGAIYSNRWHPEAIAFVARNRAALQRIPVWFFSSGPLDDSARSGSLAPVPQVTTLAREIEIRGHMTFGGVLDKRPSGLFGMFAYGAEGDFRDRRQVSEWVERIAQELRNEEPNMVRVIGRPVSRPKPTTPTVVIKREPEQKTEPVTGKRTRLRDYLSLDSLTDDDDEGLDLFDDLEFDETAAEHTEADESAELVGDPAGM